MSLRTFRIALLCFLLFGLPALGQELQMSAQTAGFKIPVPSGMEVVREKAAVDSFRSSPQGRYARAGRDASTDAILRYKGGKDYKKGMMAFSWYPLDPEDDVSSKANTRATLELAMALVYNGLAVEPTDSAWLTLGGVEFFWATGRLTNKPYPSIQTLVGIDAKKRRAYQVMSVCPNQTSFQAFKDATPRIAPR